MKLLFEMTEDILITKMDGELDHHSAGEVREIIDKTIDTFCGRHLILSFEGVTFMDSAGIGVIMGRYNKLKELSGSVLIVGCSEYAKRILEMAGIFTIARSVDSVGQAIDICKKANHEEDAEGE